MGAQEIFGLKGRFCFCFPIYLLLPPFYLLSPFKTLTSTGSAAMVFITRVRMMAMRSRARLGGGFGTSKDHEPQWIERWMANHRAGKDSMDWFFRAFNSLKIYETFLKSSPKYYGFIVMGGIIGGYGWSRMWDAIWASCNVGKLYKDCPYVYPPEEDDE